MTFENVVAVCRFLEGEGGSLKADTHVPGPVVRLIEVEDPDRPFGPAYTPPADWRLGLANTLTARICLRCGVVYFPKPEPLSEEDPLSAWDLITEGGDNAA